MTKYVLLVFANPVDGKEDEFNDFYDSVHLPDMLAVPGVSAAQRFRIGNAQQNEEPHRYLAIYEIDSDDPDVTMRALHEASESGRIRPFETLDPDTRSLVLQPIGERRTA